MNEKNTPQRMLDTAKSFYKASNRTFEPRPIGPNTVEILMMPGIVCSAFAIEVALKAIVLVEKSKELKGHNLSKLFDELSSDSKEMIKKDVENVTNDFDTDLYNIAETFVEWRYVYEQGEIRIRVDFIQNLAKATVNRAKALIP